MKETIRQTSIGIILAIIVTLQSCSVIQPNELGLKQSLGKLSPSVYTPGAHFYNPFVSKMIVYDCKILNVGEKSLYSTHDGLEVTSEMSLLYHIIPDSLRMIHVKLGHNFETKFVSSLFRSVIREEVIQYNAKDIMNKIQVLEDSISLTLRPLLSQYGFVVDKVIVSDIDLPEEVNKAIRDKVRAEQIFKQRQVEIEIDRQNVIYEAEKAKLESDSKLSLAKQETNIILEKQNAESQRMVLEARAVKQSQAIIDSTLSAKQLELKKIEATIKLAGANNSKLIITDGKSQLMFREDK